MPRFQLFKFSSSYQSVIIDSLIVDGISSYSIDSSDPNFLNPLAQNIMLI